ncbi:SpaA isopeptide-forming pilin-related protein [Maribacter algicola]|uniref:SpaA isopeptide-forming pilin-related protein n=1 Tax=Meishania litoralis TaxID=3434685 RepID=A0ACC7LLN4_9FLAO
MRKITFLCALLLTFITAFAQTTLSAGDIAFLGINTDGETDTDDSFAFILLKDVDAATQIIFTDRGWSDVTGFSSFAGDGEFTWTSGVARTAGDVIVLDFSNLSPPAASFTVLGDQLFAIQGSIASPTFIAGLHFNVVSGVTDDANWDGDATSNTTSALPDVLTTGDTAIRLTGPGGIEQDNFQFSCGIAGCPLSGTPEEIRATVHNIANWVSDNENVYPGTVDVNFAITTGDLVDIFATKLQDDGIGGVSFANDPRLPGWEFTLYDESGNELADGITDANGVVSFGAFPVGTYTICETPQPGWTNILGGGDTDPEGMSRPCTQFTVDNTVSNRSVNFWNYEVDLVDIFATKLQDDGIGGVSFANDPRLPGWEFTLYDESGNELADGITDANGVVSFGAFPVGTYTICETPQPGWTNILGGGDTDPEGMSRPCTQFTVDNTVSNRSVNFWNFDTNEVDLELEMSVDNATPNVGDPVTFTVVVTNQGPSTATGVVVTDQLPSGYTYTGFTTSQGTYNSGTGQWTLGSLVAVQSETLTVSATVNASGDYLNLAEVTAQNETDVDSTPGNGVDTNGDGNVIDDPGDEDDGDAATIDVIIPCEVSIDTQPQDVEVCEFEPYSFSVGATGNGTLTYRWESSTSGGQFWTNLDNQTESIINAPQGAFVNADGWLYRVIITSDNGTSNDPTDDCSVTSEAATLTVNPAPMVEITGNDSYCHDGNGVTLDAGAGFASYLWSPGGQTTRTITALEGSYSVTVSNELGCEATSEAFIVTNNEPLTCSIEQDRLATNHLTLDGVATVYPKGGAAEYTYLWDNGENTQTATTLTYGMHTVTVTDSNGCETTCQIDIAKELYCWTNLIQNVSIRGGSDGVASVKGNGGYRPYSFKWQDGSTEEVNKSLSAGTHYVTITDATGATSQCSVTISEPGEGSCNDFICSVEQEELATNHLTEDGVATVNLEGGSGPFTFLWDNGEITQTATTLTYGLHSVTVTDINGCEAVGQIDIAKELYCWINLYGNVTVRGGNDGSAKVQGNGGYRPYTYQWEDGTTEQLNTKLKAGTHYVTITDAIGLTSRCSITITEPNGEVCDGIDNDGDGDIDEGFDQDGDGTADCYDNCDDTIDTDGDGTPDCSDQCDDSIDSDGDGTPDCTDDCDDTIDTDGDGTPDCSDQCDDSIDSDGDGTPDCTDDCDDTIDTDGDGTPDCSDQCDDSIDSDGDGTPDCTDDCDDRIDTDGDGTPDCSDQCDDSIDSDGDGTPDCTDDCDDSMDTDQDGVPDCIDVCPGSDDTLDADGDGIPDGCDIEVCDGVDNDGDGEIDEDLNCNPGSIDKCETAFARSSDENVRTCFLDIPNISGNRWGWTNEIPSIDGIYQMDLYAAAGQCDIGKGALVGTVEVTFSNGSVNVTVSTLNDYKMTEAQLYVGSNSIPVKQNNGNLTVAPGDYPYSDTVSGDFITYTWQNLNAGDMDSFHVILHAEVCPMDDVQKYRTPALELSGYPIPFKNDITLVVKSPNDVTGELSIYDGIGQRVRTFGKYDLKKGVNEINLTTDKLPAGMYYIYVSTGNGNQILKVINKP